MKRIGKREVGEYNGGKMKALRCLRLLPELAVLCTAVLSASACLAEISDERKPQAAELPEGVPVLPDSAEKESGLLITKANIDQFSEVLLAPVAAWIKEGRFIARAVRRLNFSWELGAGWDQASRANLGRYDLDPSFNLIQQAPHVLPGGLPFGTADDLDAETDPVRKAYKILWNSAYAESPHKDSLYGIDLHWVGAQSALRHGTGTFYRRFYSGVLSEAKSGEKPEVSSPGAPPLLMRQEYLRMFSPPVIAGYAEISWRYRDAAEDDLWIYSPVSNKARRLFQANRSDPLLGGLMTFDDLFAWGEKVQSVDAKVVADKVLLLPFAAVNYYRVKPEPLVSVPTADLAEGTKPAQPKAEESGTDVLTVRGYYQRADGTNAVALWNHETKLFPQGISWIPTTASFVPRKVWVIEIGPKNPFYLEGRQILVVDKETMLPFYRIVYDHHGSYLRTTAAAWVLADGGKGQPNVPFAGFVLSVDQGMQKVMTVTTKFVRTFMDGESAPAAEIRRLLDINSYGQKKPAPPPRRPRSTTGRRRRPPMLPRTLKLRPTRRRRQKRRLEKNPLPRGCP